MSDSATRGDTYDFARRIYRKLVHWASYNFILSSKRTRNVTVGDLRLTVPPTVFHPGIFVTSRMFANYIRCQTLQDLTVAEIGTGSGVLALSAACAGATKVVALDINPAAVAAAAANAAQNQLSHIVEARLSDLLSAVAVDEYFDVIISSPPSFAGEPKDMADRAWHAGDGYRHLEGLFRQSYSRLTPNGKMLILLSSDSNIALFKEWATNVGFSWQQVAKKSIGVETFVIFHLCKGHPHDTSRRVAPLV
jgi:release factor glutamine methyltransferase